MGKRSFEQRRLILAAMIAESGVPELSKFDLSTSEQVFYRARASRALDDATRKTSSFKAFYKLPTSKPFRWIVGLTVGVVATSILIIVALAMTGHLNRDAYTLVGTCWTVSAASIGWCVASGISHRNAVRQNTQNLLLSRFAQSTHTDALHHFFARFGSQINPKICKLDVDRARQDGDEGRKAAEAVNYTLNYFEFLCSGVLCGDIDPGIFTRNLRGILIFHYDKCEPYIMYANSQNPKALEALIKVRTSYRMP